MCAQFHFHSHPGRQQPALITLLIDFPLKEPHFSVLPASHSYQQGSNKEKQLLDPGPEVNPALKCSQQDRTQLRALYV